MVSSGPPDNRPGPSPRRRRGERPGDAGLRDLGARIDGGERGAVPNESGLRSLGEQVDAAGGSGGRGGRSRRRGAGGGGRRRRWSTRRKVVTALLAVVVLLGLLAGGGYAYIRYRYDQIHKVTIASEKAQVTGQPFNILVIGSDSRLGNSKNTAHYGTATAVGGQRSDVDMIVHVDPGTKRVTLVSIPRDTLVSQVGKNVTLFGKLNRINAAYNSGPTLLVQTIQDNFGIPISHVVQVNFGGFIGAVNALGGVHMQFKYPARTYNDTTPTKGPINESGLTVKSPGCVLLNGSQALAVARSRHFQYYATGQWQTTGTGDLGRIKRQDAFLKALANQAKHEYNPFTLNAFLGSLPQGLVIDSGFSASELIGLGTEFHSINPTTIRTMTLPTFSTGFVTPWGDVLFVKQPTAQQMLVSVFGSQLSAPTSPPPSTSLVPTPPPAIAGSGGTAGGSAAPSTTAPTAGSSTGTGGTPTTAPPAPVHSSPPPTFDPGTC